MHDPAPCTPTDAVTGKEYLVAEWPHHDGAELYELNRRDDILPILEHRTKSVTRAEILHHLREWQKGGANADEKLKAWVDSTADRDVDDWRADVERGAISLSDDVLGFLSNMTEFGTRNPEGPCALRTAASDVIARIIHDLDTPVRRTSRVMHDLEPLIGTMVDRYMEHCLHAP